MAQGEWKATTQLINGGLAILEAEHPMTVRQLFYRLVSTGIIANNKKEYSRVSRLMTTARRDERCPYEWLVDRSRPTYQPNAFENPREYAEVVKRSYRRDYWHLQPCYVELWCEKDAVVGSIEDLTNSLGVTLRVSRGFMSATRVNDIAQHFCSIKKPKTIYYLGDHDPSGREIETTAMGAVVNRVGELVGTQDHGLFTMLKKKDNFELVRLAIHQTDIDTFNLPPLRVKDSDPRAVEFEILHGSECVELDALPPTELRKRIEDAVMGLVDRIAWDKAIHLEKIETNSIIEVCSKWSGDDYSVKGEQ